MERVVRQAPVRKRANIQLEARRTRWRAEIMVLGRATVGESKFSKIPHGEVRHMERLRLLGPVKERRI